MIVIFEGPDGVGKSTMCERLSRVLDSGSVGVGITYHKESKPGKSIAERLKRVQLFEERLYDKDLHIYDRATIIDDFIYEPLFDNIVSLFTCSNFLMFWIKEMLQKVLIIHLYASLDVLQERLNSRGDEYVTSDDLIRIVQLYTMGYEQLDVKPVFVNSLDDQALDECVDYIKQYVEENKE